MPKTIVCFGDSNTYGTPGMPDVDFWGRHAPDARWPGVMRLALGADWSVIEEGLPGRTTVHDDPIEGADKNGLKALPMLLGSHRPIDWLLIALGCNDLKARFAVTPEDIAASVALLVQTAAGSRAGPDARPPRMLVIVPAPIEEVGFLGGYFRGGAEKSRHLAACYAEAMARHGVPVLDAGAFVTVDPVDGIHMAVDQHAILGRAITAEIRRLDGNGPPS